MPKVESQERFDALGEKEHEGLTDTRMKATALMQVASLTLSKYEDGTFVDNSQEGNDSSQVSPTEEIILLGADYYQTSVERNETLAAAMVAQKPVETSRRADFM